MRPPSSEPAGPKKAAGQPPDVMPGDHVFAKHPKRGPIALRVTAAGKDGFRGVCDQGAKHGVPYADYLGHKARATHRFEVLDQGADGAIVQDARGGTRFLTGPLPQPEEQEGAGKGGRGTPDDPLIDGLGNLSKAFEGNDMTIPDGARLFLKAGPIANKAGLALKEVTDKAGHQTHRWQSTAQPGAGDGAGKAPMKHGDTVAFQHGQVQGQGKIVASGADGVTLEDDSGRAHKVRHEHLTGPAGGEGKPAAGKEAGEPGAAAGAADSPKAFFDEKDLASLPPKAVQPTKDRAELFAKSAEGLEHFETWLNRGKGIASQAGATTMTKSTEKVTPEEWDKPGAMLFIGKIKGEARAAEKVASDYGGDWSRLTDTVRGSIAVDSLEDLHGMVAKLKAGGMKLAQQPKDRFAKPTPVGYRDMLLNITLPNGLVGELQLHVKSMLKAKNEGHKHYETERTLDGKAKRGEALSDAEKAELKAAQDKQSEIYKKAWGGGADRVSGGGRDMAKALGGSEGFSFFENEGAQFRRKNTGVTRSVDDVLQGGKWTPYKGADPLLPALMGNEIQDPTGQGGTGEDSGEPMAKAEGVRLFLPASGTTLAKAHLAERPKEISPDIAVETGARLPQSAPAPDSVLQALGGMVRKLLFRRA